MIDPKLMSFGHSASPASSADLPFSALALPARVYSKVCRFLGYANPGFFTAPLPSPRLLLGEMGLVLETWEICSLAFVASTLEVSLVLRLRCLDSDQQLYLEWLQSPPK